MIVLRCLGPVEVSLDGVDPPPELLWRKNLALLIYLARSPRGRSREHLIGALWPDKDDTKARHSLNEALRVLRRSLGAALHTEGETIRISAGAVSADVDRLEDVEPEALRLRFLEGFAVPDARGFEEWLSGERQAVQTAQLAVLGKKAEAELSHGASIAARELGLAALRLDPHHEPSASMVMKAQALDGDRAAALQTYERFSAELRDLGLEPSTVTRTLAQRIRDERIVRGSPVAGPGKDRGALVGAARLQLANAIRVWSTARQHGAHVIVLLGDPGTGKTRLADELAARAELDGAAVARVRAVDGEPVRETWAALLRGGLEVAELSGAAPEALATLAELDPDIRTRFASARGAAALPLSEGLLVALRAVAEARPILVIVDDAHRADPEVVRTLASLVERAPSLPICVVVAAARTTSSAVDAFAERVGRDLPGEVLQLAALDEAEVVEVVKSVFPGYAAEQGTRLARRIVADTAGNPFLTVEVIRAVRQGMNLPDADSSAWPAARRTLDDTRPGDLPPSVAAALRLRFRQLTEPAQRTLAAIAVLGGATPPEPLARAADVAGPELERALDELEWTRWLSGDSRGYVFATRLAREVVLADMVTAGQQRRMKEKAK